MVKNGFSSSPAPSAGTSTTHPEPVGLDSVAMPDDAVSEVSGMRAGLSIPSMAAHLTKEIYGEHCKMSLYIAIQGYVCNVNETKN